MATYGYRAITKAGKEVKGSLEADNKDLAMAELRRQELTVIDLGEQSFLTKDIDIQIGGWPKARDLSVMCRQFVSMTKAGVSILESLKMLCEQTENKRLQDALKEVRISVEKGETLADSMAEHPKVFPAIMVNMVAAGEASGSLETALDRVAVQLEKNSKTQAMLKKAMIYPVVVCIVAVIVTIVMLVKVIPSYEDMFSQLGADLPWITKFYVAMSHGIQNYWFIIIPVIIAAAIGISQTLIGLTVVAFGTSLPELVTSIVAAKKGEVDMALGNVIGSNIFNILMVLGIAAAISPVAFLTENIIDIAVLIVFSVFGWIMAWTKRELNRKEGIIMLLLYAVYVVYICMR